MNVCRYRIPKRISIISPPSFCPNCRKKIRPYDNIPVVSYILLGGRCRHCKKRISPIYPIVELITGITFYLLARKISLSLPLFLSFGYFSLLILTAFLDWEERGIYDPIIYLGVVFGFLFNFNQPLFAILGILVGVVALFLLRVFGFLWKKKEALGMGDIFLGGMIGSLLGWGRTLLAIFFGAFFGLVVSLLLIVFKVWRKEDYIPFGSFLSLGTGLVFLFGDKIISAYLHLFYLMD